MRSQILGRLGHEDLLVFTSPSDFSLCLEIALFLLLLHAARLIAVDETSLGVFENVVSSISWIISGNVVALLSTAPLSG